MVGSVNRYRRGSLMETPHSIFASSRSRKCSGVVRAKCTRLG